MCVHGVRAKQAKAKKLRGAPQPAAQRGMAVVELALILPVFLLVVFVMAELSILYYDKIIITNASREAARAGIVLKATKLTTVEISNVATSYLSNYLITYGTATSTPSVSVSGAQGLFGSPLSVTVSYTFRPLGIAPLLAPGNTPVISGPLTLTSTTVMNNE